MDRHVRSLVTAWVTESRAAGYRLAEDDRPACPIMQERGLHSAERIAPRGSAGLGGLLFGGSGKR